MSDHDTQNAPNRGEYPDQAPRQSRNKTGPDLVGYTVKDRGEGKEPYWLAIGGAWKHEDGKGMTLQLDAAPLDGKITLREKRREDYEKQRTASDHAPERGHDHRR
jgi:hypothetical protein